MGFKELQSSNILQNRVVMGIRNQIISYFVDPSDPPKVYRSPVTMNDEVAKTILKEELGAMGTFSGKKLLHVCFDRDSEIIYIPNAHSFSNDQIYPLLMAAKYHIVKEFENYKMVAPIKGSPFSSLRVRSVKSFGYVEGAIREHFKKDIDDLTVIEANLAKMPETVKHLPAIYKNNKNYAGGLIKKSHAKEISFIDEIDIKGKTRKKSIRLMTVKTPFILIDISPEIDPTPTQKEWAVLSGYRDYITENIDNPQEDAMSFAPLYAAKRYLYMGWPFEEVCKVMLEFVKDFGALIKGIDRLLLSASELKDEGYADVTKYSYYMSFKIDLETFPLNFQDAPFQIPFFDVVEYDEATGFIIIKTPAYIDNDICFKILKSKSRPFIVKYNPTYDKIDVKVQPGVYKELRLKSKIPAKIEKMIREDIKADKELEFRADKRSRSVSLSSNELCHIRSINDYYYAKDHILDMCKKRGMEFDDIQVVVGPIERIFGRGIQGGFMDKKSFEKSKLKIPFQIEKGLYVNPPIMAVNSESMPSYAAQTETLIHEYSHKLFSISDPEHEHLYNKDPKLKDRDPRKYWDLYLGDEDEKIAHQEEIRFELKSGKSVDEIVRDKVGGAITKDSYRRTYITALKYKEMVDEVAEEMEE